ncbi:beta-N-acetylhexosaminidase [Paenactinomyces guangxiensis]|nr:beta-N-acetylhexosaminidase [Paenactinomyces guangxiensis]
MSLDEKIGQMFIVGFQETSGGEATVANEHAKKLITDHHVGGIIYFDRNIQSPGQVGALSNELQDLALSSSPQIPLFISIDQEGGKVVRIKEGVTVFPGNMALGAARDPDLAYQTGKQMGMELRAMGINLNMAPVLDVNNNPKNPVIGVRSFSENPELTAQMSVSMIKGFRDGKVLSAVKHFPGHGDTSLDSHIDLPQIPHNRKRLDRVELVPFREAIAHEADMVMTTHITFPALEPTPGLPATLSKNVLISLLRKELGYQGVIITDDLEMGAIAKNFGTPVAAVRAIQAGADMVLICHSQSKQEKSIEAVKQAVEKGILTEKRIDESVRRILKLKAERLGENSIIEKPHTTAKEIKQRVGNAETKALSVRIAEKAVTLVNDQRKFLPLPPTSHSRLLVLTSQKPETFREALEQEGFTPEVVLTDELDKEKIPELVRQAEQMDAVVVGVSRLKSGSAQAELISRLQAGNKPVIIVGLDTPYDPNALPKESTYLTAYGSTTASLTAVSRAISGKIPLTGRLPVTISETYPFGSGVVQNK